MKYFKFQFLFFFVIIEQLISLIICIKSVRLSSYSYLTSTLHKSTTTMDSDETADDSGRNLMHQTNDEICIGENAKVTQHYPYFQNFDVGDDEENIEAPHRPILDVNIANKNACICQIENVLEGHTCHSDSGGLRERRYSERKKYRIYVADSTVPETVVPHTLSHAPVILARRSRRLSVPLRSFIKPLSLDTYATSWYSFLSRRSSLRFWRWSALNNPPLQSRPVSVLRSLVYILSTSPELTSLDSGVPVWIS